MSKGTPLRDRGLPKYLQDYHALVAPSKDRTEQSVYQLIDFDKLSSLPTFEERLLQLLLRRHYLTTKLASHGKCHPATVLERARVYEALAYDDLAAFDAFVVYTLCEKELSEEFVTDLEATGDGEAPWPPTNSEEQIPRTKAEALAVLSRCLFHLGAKMDARMRLYELEKLSASIDTSRSGSFEWPDAPFWTTLLHEDVNMAFMLNELDNTDVRSVRFGRSRRELYPWSTYEPIRDSKESVKELNKYLSSISSQLEARFTALPAFDKSGEPTGEISQQLGLFAKSNLQPGAVILSEKCVLTAIRPWEDAICNTCGQELEGIPFDTIRQCEGEDCDVTFCSQDCKDRAITSYHRPQHETDLSSDESSDVDDETISNSGKYERNESIDTTPEHDIGKEQYPTPFCGNQDLNLIGRPTNTTTPEWDLYFLLLVRAIEMSTTQGVHPLSLIETKYLWGDFQPSPFLAENVPSSTNLSITLSRPRSSYVQSLPFSFMHNLQYTLDFFSTLSLSYPAATPYSASWLENYDFWILQTLHAKFRGVANATQSTFDGKPEIASVHPGWSLANHSCAPNVKWNPKGLRTLTVRTASERTWVDNGTQEDWEGIKCGEEILSHYTDVRLPVQERCERLREVLGGKCRCERCLIESNEVNRS